MIEKLSRLKNHFIVFGYGRMEKVICKELQKEIEKLKKLLLKKDLDAMIQDSYLEVAAEDLGYKSVAELKKKLNIER